MHAFRFAFHLVVIASVAVVSFAAAVANGHEENAKRETKPEVPEWQAKFDEVYKLADGENAKRIGPPFIPERAAFHRKRSPGVGSIEGQYRFRWKDGKRSDRAGWSSATTVESSLSFAGLDRADLVGDKDAFEFEVPGDWIIREDAPAKDVLADMQRAITKATKGRITFEPAKADREVIVARGTYAFKPLADPPPRQLKSVHLFTEELDTRDGWGGGVGTMSEFLRRVGTVAGRKIVDETEPYKGKVDWTNNRSADQAAKSPKVLDQLLKNVSDQTGLTLELEVRTVDAWRVIDTTSNVGGL